jgi:WD40 repeat protein
MQRDELQRAITCPAERVGLTVEDTLVDALVDDVADAPGALPLLSTALLELWQRRDGRWLRHASYDDTGGVSKAVGRLAEDAYGQLDAAQQAVARNVLVHLAAVGADGAVERRRVPLAELESERSDDVKRVVDLFTERRLLTVSAGSVEVAHEALLREWERLRGWIDDDRKWLRIHRDVTAAANEWREREHDHGVLLRGGPLTDALEWQAIRPALPDELERAFLAESEAQRRHERTALRRRRRLALAGLTGVLVAAIAVVIVMIFAERERDIAASRDLAIKSMSLNAADPALGLAVALEALDRHDTPQARNAVRQATYANRGTAMAAAHEGIAYQVALAPDGKQLATSGEDRAVRVWTVDGLRPVATIARHKTDAIAVAYSPDGETIASTHTNGDIMLNPAHGGEPRRALRLKRDYARSVAFSNDGETLLIGTDRGVVGLVRIGDETPVVRRLGKHAQRARTALSPDGTKAVSASDDGTVRIWSIEGGPPLVLEHPSGVTDAEFSPDGRHVVTAGVDGFARLWDASTGEPVRQIRVDDGILGRIHFSPDARRLVAVGDDAAVRIVNADGGPVLGELRGHAGPAYAAIFTDEGDSVVSVGQDGTVRKWAPPQVIALPVGGSADAPFELSFSTDGQHMVTSHTDGDVRIWDIRDGSHTDLPGHAWESVVTYSPNGRFMVSASFDGTVRLWDVGLRRSRPVVTGPATKNAAAVDPTGEWVAIAALERPTVIQRPDGSDRIVLRGHESEVTTLAFSPDGKHLLSASEDATVRIWRTADGRQERVLADHDKAVMYAAFSSDGQDVVTAETDGTVRTWALESDEPRVLYGHELQVNSAEFSRSGERVVTTGQDGTVRVWDSGGGEPILVALERDGSVTAAHFSPDGSRLLSVGEDGFLLSVPCEVCGSLSDVLGLAGTRLQPTLSSADRQRLQLGED